VLHASGLQLIHVSWHVPPTVLWRSLSTGANPPVGNSSGRNSGSSGTLTWSCISDSSGHTTTVTPLQITAGNCEHTMAAAGAVASYIQVCVVAVAQLRNISLLGRQRGARLAAVKATLRHRAQLRGPYAESTLDVHGSMVHRQDGKVLYALTVLQRVEANCQHKNKVQPLPGSTGSFHLLWASAQTGHAQPQPASQCPSAVA
jgi:hypothetical protein